jgi:hypothetical protein
MRVALHGKCPSFCARPTAAGASCASTACVKSARAHGHSSLAERPTVKQHLPWTYLWGRGSGGAFQARRARHFCSQEEANAIVAPIHPKAMRVILTTPGEVDQWLSTDIGNARAVQRPLPDRNQKAPRLRGTLARGRRAPQWGQRGASGH